MLWGSATKCVPEMSRVDYAIQRRGGRVQQPGPDHAGKYQWRFRLIQSHNFLVIEWGKLQYLMLNFFPILR